MEDNIRSYTPRVIDETYIFPEELLKHFKNNANVTFNIPTDVKNNLKQMAMKQGLYAQVVIIRRKDLKIIEENNNNNEDKFKFQGRSAIS